MKKIKLFILLTILFIISPTIVNAASGTYSISSSSSVEEGSSFSVTFQISASKMFYWQAYITYDTSKLQLVSGSTNFQGESESMSGQSSAKKTLKFKAKSKGTAWVTISMGDKGNNINIDTQEISFSKKTKNITITEKKVIPKKEYSSNNYLKNLTIDGYKLNPEFNKNTLQYNVELPADTTKVTINATKEDQTATISGSGEQTVSEGINKLKVKVTAENGNIKEYIINATVLEPTTIEVTVGKDKFTVLRKKDQLPKANSSYEETTVEINNEQVPALKSEITNFILVGLKDTEGNTLLYKYNQKDNSYELYTELTFNKLLVVPSSNYDAPKGYKQITIMIGENKVIAYKKDNSYPIFYGINIETGKENWYTYDEVENTIQIFKEKKSKSFLATDGKLGTNILGALSGITSGDKLELYIISGLAGFLVITYAVILINLIKKNKKQKKIQLNNNS